MDTDEMELPEYKPSKNMHGYLRELGVAESADRRSTAEVTADFWQWDEEWTDELKAGWGDWPEWERRNAVLLLEPTRDDVANVKEPAAKKEWR
jgi:hypothetical protein